MIARGTTRRSAFTLVEMVVVLVGLAACMALGVGLLVTVTRAGRTAEAASNEFSKHIALGRQFRDDVHRAEAAPDTIGDQTASPTQLLLRMPDGKAVAYRWEEGNLERVAIDGKDESRQIIPLEPKEVGIEFVRQAGVITLRITPKPETKKRPWELTAALGGPAR